MSASLLYLTDFYYQAKGRKYYEEDLQITRYLKDYFHLVIAHPQQAIPFLNAADAVVIRNTGPVIYYLSYFEDFKHEVTGRKLLSFNSLDGKADMQGKNYLVELTKKGYPVIPSIRQMQDLPLLGESEKWVIKSIQGADSIGMQVVSRQPFNQLDLQQKIIQPWITFEYEVSFYFLNNEFQYALYAPDKQKRWQLAPYEATPEDLQFAQQFINWNQMQHSLQRVDACRLPEGRLLLVELEDLNPYLSLDLLSFLQQERFLNNFKTGLQRMFS